ncbi:MAG: hypothetical protein JWR35_1644 [Marmoricola sp.]|nr:hypothetical protein [Marmoricola sp.]
MLETAAFPNHAFTYPQAAALGFTRRQIDDAVRNRIVRRVLRNVYLRADVPDTVESRVAAATLVISEHSVACDRTAAWIHGVDVVAYRETEILPPLETYVLRWHAPTARAGCDGGTRDLVPADIVEIRGLRVTTPLRTALDLGCKLSRRDGLFALDAFMREHGVRHSEMTELVRRFRRRRGVVQLRQLIAMADPRSESSGESWTRLEIIDHAIPWPELQCWIEIDGIPTYRLDLAWPRSKVAVEYDGEEFHTSAAQRERDRERREWLRDHGWIVIVVDKDSFTAEAVDEWIAELRAALRLRG